MNLEQQESYGGLICFTRPFCKTGVCEHGASAKQGYSPHKMLMCAINLAS